MTENMITVALIIGDPGREDLQLDEGSLAAAAKMMGVHGVVTHGRRDGQAEHYVVFRHRASPRRGSQGRSASHLGRQA
jgi:hypothetical protein